MVIAKKQENYSCTLLHTELLLFVCVCVFVCNCCGAHGHEDLPSLLEHKANVASSYNKSYKWEINGGQDHFF